MKPESRSEGGENFLDFSVTDLTLGPGRVGRLGRLIFGSIILDRGLNKGGLGLGFDLALTYDDDDADDDDADDDDDDKLDDDGSQRGAGGLGATTS